MTRDRQSKCCLHPFLHTLVQCVAWQYPPFTTLPLRVSAEEPDLAAPPRRADGPGSSLEPRDRLRASPAEGSTPISTPQPGSGLTEPSAGVRERVNRLGRE